MIHHKQKGTGSSPTKRNLQKQAEVLWPGENDNKLLMTPNKPPYLSDMVGLHACLPVELVFMDDFTADG